MRALVITKPTNYEQHGEVVRAQIARQKLEPIHIEELELAHSEHYESLEQVKRSLAKHGIPFDEISRANLMVNGDDYGLIISVGGDGTLLSASHRILSGTPVIGVRSSGSSVGYLCAGGIRDVDLMLDQFMRGELKFSQCARIKATIYFAEEHQERQTVPILNDFLFANYNPAATTRYRITHGSITESHKSSGVWIATATGSTAGLKAAGGKAMSREDTRFQYMVRELYQPPGASFQLVNQYFDPDTEKFSLENQNESAVLALDGQRGVVPLKFGDRIDFFRAPPIRIAMPFKSLS